MTYPNLNIDPELLKKRKDDQLKKLEYKTEKYDHENILKLPKIEYEYYRKKYKKLNKKKVLLIVTEILVGSLSAVGSPTMGLINPGAEIIISSSTALLNSFAFLIKN